MTLSYRSRTEEARRLTAMNKQKQRLKSVADPTSQYGPPDHSANFSRKRYASDLPSSSNAPKHQAVSVDNDIIQFIPNNHPEILGKCARMKFENKEGEEEWCSFLIQCNYRQI